MIEKILFKKKLFAIIIRGNYRNKKGVNFFTPNYTTQQIGYMNHKKDHIIKPHQHKNKLTKNLNTTETILLLKGILRVDFYNQKKKYLFSKVLKEKDIIMLVHILLLGESEYSACQIDNADLNGNANLNVLDIIELVNLIIGE